MKKVSLALVVLLAIAGLVMMGCKEDDPAPGPGPNPPEITDPETGGSAFDNAVGMTPGIAIDGDATFAEGIVTFTAGSSIIGITIPSATTAGTKTIKIEYICISEGEPKVILKSGKGWSDGLSTANGTDGCNWYPTLEKDVVTTLETKEAWYPAGKTEIGLQSNAATGVTFKVKIISVKVE